MKVSSPRPRTASPVTVPALLTTTFPPIVSDAIGLPATPPSRMAIPDVAVTVAEAAISIVEPFAAIVWIPAPAPPLTLPPTLTSEAPVPLFDARMPVLPAIEPAVCLTVRSVALLALRE
ncbi:hypothetical protein D3C87_1713310 [compost metagenome]